MDGRWFPRIDRALCTGCGECVARCPTGALGMRDGLAALIRPEACTYTALCEGVCPVGAIALPYVVCSLAEWHSSAQPSQGGTVSNFVYFPDLTAQLPEIPPDSILSRTLHADDDVKVVLFGFAAGQELSEHTASQPASILVLRGEADLTLGDEKRAAGPGTWVHMPPNLPHSVHARTPLIMLLLLVRSARKEGSGTG